MIHCKNKSYRISAWFLHKLQSFIFRKYFPKKTKNTTFDLTFNCGFYENVIPHFKNRQILLKSCCGFMNTIKYWVYTLGKTCFL